jgi:hypothetical protein
MELTGVRSCTLANEQGWSLGSEKTDSGSSTGKDEVRDQVEIKLVVYGT